MNKFKLTLVMALVLWTADAMAESANPQDWRSQMQKISKTLTDAFPFFYSKSEFRDPDNKDRILKHMQVLADATHKLPVRSGEMLIGAEPLIESAQAGIKSELNEAIVLYKNKKFTEAQSLVHNSMQKCFACHTGYQIGRQMPATNKEISGMATPFALGKAVVFGALRQFNGALDWIEKNGADKEDLIKLHLVVSLRALQDFDRPTAFLKKLGNSKNAPSPEVVKAWLADIRSWKELSGDREKALAFIAEQRKAPRGSMFVIDLFDSYITHQMLSTNPADKAALYLRLGTAYEALDFSPLNELPKIYFAACVKADPTGLTGAKCAKLQTTP